MNKLDIFSSDSKIEGDTQKTIKFTMKLMVFLPFQITGLVPKINALQEALPKSIGLLSFDGGIAGNMLAGGNHGSKFHCE